jgi:enamine deaminase RidA (YjgF/YER057c/UK114 family)
MEVNDMSDPIVERLAALGLSLPETCAPRGNFLPYRRCGDTVYLAGQICEWNGTVTPAGKVGQEVAMEQAKDGARTCALNLLFHLRRACGGNLGRVRQCLRVGGFVNCIPGFDAPPAVVNGASDLFIALFGDAGRHARTAVGVAALPAGAAVEVDAIFEIDAPR